MARVEPAEKRETLGVAVTAVAAEHDGTVRRAEGWWTFPSTRWSLIILLGVYLPMALTYSFLTREYEAFDEPAHVHDIEYIVTHHALPRIAVANGLESHQPPLYYLVAAGWQEVLGIPAFTPIVVPAKGPLSFGDRLLYSTDYTPSEHADAVHVHELRLLSVAFGLGTVLLTYAAARIIGMREWLALASGLFVALYPKNLVAASSVTNDALVIPLCGLALVLYLLSERSRMQKRFRDRRIYVTAMGVALGAAALTKLTSLPIAAVLFALAFIPLLRAVGRHSDSRTQLRLFLDVLLAVVGFFVISGWWFLRNQHLYGQLLASSASERYLRVFDIGPEPWSVHLFLLYFPNTLLNLGWYNQPNLILPTRLDEALAVLAVPCLAVGAWVTVLNRQWISRLSVLSSISFPACILGGFVAVVVIIKDTGQGDFRDALGGRDCHRDRLSRRRCSHLLPYQPTS